MPEGSRQKQTLMMSNWAAFVVNSGAPAGRLERILISRSWEYPLAPRLAGYKTSFGLTITRCCVGAAAFCTLGQQASSTITHNARRTDSDRPHVDTL